MAGYNGGVLVDATADVIRLDYKGTAEVTTTADLLAANDGIHAVSTSGGVGATPLTIQNVGTITAGRDGIYVASVDNSVAGCGSPTAFCLWTRKA